jgi:hypothetical protein
MTAHSHPLSAGVDGCMSPASGPIATHDARRYRRKLFAALGLAVGLGFLVVARAQSGQTLDWYTREPIAGVELTLDCEGMPFFQPEGHRHIRTVSRRSDSAGRYSFPVTDRIGCQEITLYARKDGYGTWFPSPEDAVAGRSIPGVTYLVKTSDTVWYELERYTPSPTPGIRGLDGSIAWLYVYTEWFEAFFKMKRIATTPREVAFVNEHYCTQLRTLYTRLTDAEKASTATSPVEYNFGGKHESASGMDFAAEVGGYCSHP